MGMAGVGNAVAVCPRVASCSSTYPCRVSKKLDSAFRPCGVSESLRLVLSVLVTRQRIPIQRRTLNTDPGPCGSGPDVQCTVPYGNPGSGVSGSPSGSGGSEADACFGASGGDAGGSRCRAAGCAGLIGFPRPEDETVGQVGVPLVPSHSAHPVGMVLAEPDHMPMKPVGTASSSRFRSCGSAISAPPNGPPS